MLTKINFIKFVSLHSLTYVKMKHKDNSTQKCLIISVIKQILLDNKNIQRSLAMKLYLYYWNVVENERWDLLFFKNIDIYIQKYLKIN